MNKEIIAINQDPVVGTSVTPFRWGINVGFSCFRRYQKVLTLILPAGLVEQLYPPSAVLERGEPKRNSVYACAPAILFRRKENLTFCLKVKRLGRTC